MNSLIGRPVYCAVSQNGALPARINASIYSIDTTFYVLFTYVIETMLSAIVMLSLLRKRKKDEIKRRNILDPDPV